MTSLANRRPRSFPRTLGFLLKGSDWNDARLVVFLAAITMIAMISSATLLVLGHSARPKNWVPVPFYVTLPLMAALTAAIESTAIRTLGFIKILPFPRAWLKWLVLAPLCSMALPMVVVWTAVFGLSIVDGVALLGFSWWAISVGHWFAGRRPWLLLIAMPLCCWIVVLISALADSKAGGGLRALIAMAFAVVGLFASPQDRVGQVMSGRQTRSRSGTRGDANVTGVTGSRPRSIRAGLFFTSWRLWSTVTPPVARYAVVFGSLPVAMLFTVQLSPVMPIVLLTVIVPMATGVAAANSRAVLGFLRTRPFSRASLIGGTVAPWAILLLVPSLIGFLGVRKESFMGPTAFAAVSGSGRRSTLSYLREVVGATFLPTTFPVGGLPSDAWLALRPLLYQHACRLLFLTIALFFSIEGLLMTAMLKDRGRRRWWRWLLLVITLAVTAPCVQDTFAGWHVPWAPPPLWLTGILALATVASTCAQHLNVRRRTPSP